MIYVKTFDCKQCLLNFERISVLVTCSSKLFEVRIEDCMKTILEGEQAINFLQSLINENEDNQAVKYANSLIKNYKDSKK